MLRSHGLPITHTLVMNEGQVITKELLRERFGKLNAAQKAYKETHGVTAGSWDKLVAKVQNLPIPSPLIPLPIKKRVIPIKERVQTLEDTVNVLSEKLQQLLDRGGIIQESEKLVNKISSYEEFKEVVLEAYERLNYDYNYNSSVPIYVIRRDMGERVTRSQFKEWMLKIRLERILSFYIRDNVSATEEEIRDSIYDDNLGIRYFFAQKN